MESVAPAPRPLTITRDLQRAMTKDLARRLGRRWYTIAVLVAMVVIASIALALGVITRDAVSLGFAVAAAVLGFGLVFMYRLLARRAVAWGYPEGAVATASVTADALLSSTAVGTTEMKFLAFTDIRLTEHSVLLSLRATGGGVAVLPRGALREEEIGQLRDGIVRSRR